MLGLDFSGDAEKRCCFCEDGVFFEFLWPQNEIDEPGLVFEGHESDPRRGARALAADDEAGITRPPAVFHLCDGAGVGEFLCSQRFAKRCQRVAMGAVGRGVVVPCDRLEDVERVESDFALGNG